MNDGGPAYPVQETENHEGHPGMSLRDWFAGMAMQGEWASPETEHSDDVAQRYCAEIAYEQADAMLAKREKANEEEQTPC